MHLRHDYDLIDLSLGDVPSAAHNMLLVDFSYCVHVLESNEITLAVNKSFQNKSTTYSIPSYKDIVVRCLSSDRYGVLRQEVLDCVTNYDMDLVWQFIDTISVS